MTTGLRRRAEQLFARGLEAADAGGLTRQAFRLDGNALQLRSPRSGSARDAGMPAVADETLPLDDFERVLFTGAGKAAAWMASSIEESLGDRLSGGVVLAPPGPAPPLSRIRLFHGGHPLPDPTSATGIEALLRLWRGAGPRDLLIGAWTGGGSALLSQPCPPIGWNDLHRVTADLLRAGAPIEELNIVRKHLCATTGGQLVRCTRASIRSLILSDVIGDAIDQIASGPTAPDPSSFEEAWSILERHGMIDGLPPPVRERLGEGRRGALPGTPKPGDPIFDRVRNFVIGSAEQALDAIAVAATEAGWPTIRQTAATRGEAREAGAAFARLLRELNGPCCLLAGGETTVRVRGGGRGGRNLEFALGAALALEGTRDALILSAGTDGIDGTSEAAGAIVDHDTIGRARSAGLDPAQTLRENDTEPFFAALGDLIRTGPTRTNVMDVQIGLRQG